MNITPLSTYVSPIGVTETQTDSLPQRALQPSFLDVFTRIFGQAIETGQVQSADRVRLMLGEADDIEQIQLNIQKAELATELLVNVRNTVLDSYNEIIRMQI